MTTNISHLSLFLLVAASGPCAEPAPLPPDLFAVEHPLHPEADVAERASSAPQQTKTTRAFMRAHSGDAVAMRQAAVAGQLDRFQQAASGIASDEWSPHLRADYGAHVAVLRGAARTAVESKDIASATAALGQVGQACADCHRAVGGPPPPGEAGALPASEDSMVVHAAAAEALWQGLVFPSDARWLSGAQQLASAPAFDSDSAQVSALAHRVGEMAREAGTAPAGERGPLYGKILSTCAACHRLAGVEPK